MINEKSRQRFDRSRPNIRCLSIQQAPNDSIVAHATGLDADGIRRHSGSLDVNPSQARERIDGIKELIRSHETHDSGWESAWQEGNLIRATNSTRSVHTYKEEGGDDKIVPRRGQRRDSGVASQRFSKEQPSQLWDHSAFQQRIRDRLEQIGTPAQTLLRDIGGQSDEIRTQLKEGNKGRGPNVNVVLRIAQALRWTIGQAMGTEDPTLFLDEDGVEKAASTTVAGGKRKSPIDPLKLQWALCFVDQYYIETTGSDNRYIEKSLGYAEAVNVIYSFLSEEESEGRSADPEGNPTLRLAIRTLLRQL